LVSEWLDISEWNVLVESRWVVEEEDEVIEDWELVLLVPVMVEVLERAMLLVRVPVPLVVCTSVAEPSPITLLF